MDIGFDFDGVIASTIHLKHRMAKEMFGVEGIPSHRFRENWVVEAGYMTREQYRKLMNTVCGDNKIGMEAAPVKDVEAWLPKLRRDGHRLVIITSREDSEFEVVKEWCQKRSWEFEYISVGYRKDKKAASQDLQVYMDDDLLKLLPLVGTVQYLYLFDQDHNKKDVNLPENIKRINTWEEFYNEINLLNER